MSEQDGATFYDGSQQDEAPAEGEKRVVLFLCQHGGAKSVMAAAYFDQLANDLSLPLRAVAAASEDAYADVPSPVADFMAQEGLSVRDFKPRQVRRDDLATAERVVSIGCELGTLNLQDADVRRWDDVPMASVDVVASASAIRKHVEELIDEIELSERS